MLSASLNKTLKIYIYISEVTGIVCEYPVPYNKKINVSSTQTLTKIKLQKFIGQIKQHLMRASPITYVTNGIQYWEREREREKCFI